MIEAISMQVTLVFGLLRYARNDKKQDGRVVFKKSPRHDNSHLQSDKTEHRKFLKKIKCAGKPAHLKEHPRSGLQIK